MKQRGSRAAELGKISTVDSSVCLYVQKELSIQIQIHLRPHPLLVDTPPEIIKGRPRTCPLFFPSTPNEGTRNVTAFHCLIWIFIFSFILLVHHLLFTSLYLHSSLLYHKINNSTGLWMQCFIVHTMWLLQHFSLNCTN